MKLVEKMIQAGLYEKAYNMLSSFPYPLMHDLLFTLACENNINIYAFTNYLILKNDCLEYRYEAQEMCHCFFLYMPGAPYSEYSYMEYLSAKEPNNLKCLEIQTDFFEHREARIFSNAEMFVIIERIFSLNPKSQIGLHKKKRVKQFANEPLVEIGADRIGVEKTKAYIEKGRF